MEHERTVLPRRSPLADEGGLHLAEASAKVGAPCPTTRLRDGRATYLSNARAKTIAKIGPIGKPNPKHEALNPKQISMLQ